MNVKLIADIILENFNIFMNIYQSGSVDYELLMKTIYAVANPEWNLASDPMPPELDILEPQKNKRTNKEFLKIFEEIFQQSAPIRLRKHKHEHSHSSYSFRLLI